MKVLILADSHQRADWNQADFANCFLERGDTVFYGLINSISTRNYEVYCNVVQVTSKVEHYGGVNQPVSRQCIEHYNLIWVLNQPHHFMAKDIWQILWMLSKRVPFVNSIEGMVFLNNKNNLGLIVPSEHLVENYVSNEYEELWSLYNDRSNELWMVKPTNSGCGADIYLLKPGDTNRRTILQSMTGNTSVATETNNVNLIGLQNTYCILQGYAPQVAEGEEKNVVIAGGKVLAQHGRRVAAGDHRSNLLQGGELIAADLTTEEMDMCSQVALNLFRYGVNFAKLDIAYPYVLEVNIVNPAGIYDILEVTGIDYNDPAVDLILAALQLPRSKDKGEV